MDKELRFKTHVAAKAAKVLGNSRTSHGLCLSDLVANSARIMPGITVTSSEGSLTSRHL